MCDGLRVHEITGHGTHPHPSGEPYGDEQPHMADQSRLRSFLSGVLAAVAGTAVGHLVAALIVPASSPVLAVGTAVINLTPTPLKVWAVRELGTKDKPVLIGSVLLGTLVLAGVAGISPADASPSVRDCSCCSWRPPALPR